jgi:glycosyltransferase involved in cell wall biosynthesis
LLGEIPLLLLMFLFVQPFGAAAQNGGARIIRSLAVDAPLECSSLCTALEGAPFQTTMREDTIPSRFSVPRLDRTRFRGCLDMLLAPASEPLFIRRVERHLDKLGVTRAHLTAHGDDFWPVYKACYHLGIPVTVAVHDDFTPYLRPESRRAAAYTKLEAVWNGSERRIVISSAMGQFYEDRFGQKGFEVITDSLETIENSPHSHSAEPLTVYFMGSMHMSYRDNFSTLCEALRLYANRSGHKIRLIVRGASPQVTTDGIDLEVRPWAGEDSVLRDMKDASLLYLPLPFDPNYENFVKYSFSTKLISYLGSGLPILYHGPRQSAVADSLVASNAALLVCEFSRESIVRALESSTVESRRTVATNALAMAERDFRASVVKDRFWSFYTGGAGKD